MRCYNQCVIFRYVCDIDLHLQYKIGNRKNRLFKSCNRIWRKSFTPYWVNLYRKRETLIQFYRYLLGCDRGPECTKQWVFNAKDSFLEVDERGKVLH